MKILFLTQLLCLLTVIAAPVANEQKAFSHGLILINPDGYMKLPSDVRDWLESEEENDKKLTKNIKVVEAEDGKPINTHKLEFITSKGQADETVLVDHIPLSMIKSLVKEKTFDGSYLEKSHQDL